MALHLLFSIITVDAQGGLFPLSPAQTASISNRLTNVLTSLDANTRMLLRYDSCFVRAERQDASVALDFLSFLHSGVFACIIPKDTFINTAWDWALHLRACNCTSCQRGGPASWDALLTAANRARELSAQQMTDFFASPTLQGVNTVQTAWFYLTSLAHSLHEEEPEAETTATAAVAAGETWMASKLQLLQTVDAGLAAALLSDSAFSEKMQTYADALRVEPREVAPVIPVHVQLA